MMTNNLEASEFTRPEFLPERAWQVKKQVGKPASFDAVPVVTTTTVVACSDVAMQSPIAEMQNPFAMIQILTEATAVAYCGAVMQLLTTEAVHTMMQSLIATFVVFQRPIANSSVPHA